MDNPREGLLAVTYRCNAHCLMCNIWKTETHSEISPIHYAKLPKSLRVLNITGGEPFLRNDLIEVVRSIHARVPSSRLVFSTNGLMTERIVKIVTEIVEIHKRVGVGVSIDGVKETHDRIRGIDGGYERAMTTVRELKRIGLKDLRIAMTISPDNVREVAAVFGIARELEVEFTCTLTHNSDIYFKKSDNPAIDTNKVESVEALTSVVKTQLRSRSPKDWFRAYHAAGMIDPEIRKSFRFHCEAGRRYFFMAPNGDVYPCNVMNRRIGNISSVERWEDMLTEKMRAEIAESVKNCGLNCWMVCNTRSLILSHPLRAVAWIVRHKLIYT